MAPRVIAIKNNNDERASEEDRYNLQLYRPTAMASDGWIHTTERLRLFRCYLVRKWRDSDLQIDVGQVISCRQFMTA